MLRSDEQFAELAFLFNGVTGGVDKSKRYGGDGAADALGSFAFGIGEGSDPAVFRHAVHGNNIRVRVKQSAEFGLHGEA